MPIEMPERIEADRIYLEKPTPTFESARQMYDLVNQSRDHILPWLDWAATDATRVPEDCFSFMKDSADRWRRGACFEYLIHDKATHQIVGGFSVIMRDQRHFGVVEFAYWLGKPYIGRGLMTEAVRAAEAVCWPLGIERIVIRNDPLNTASVCVARRSGYTLEGVARRGRFSVTKNCWHDCNVFSKIKDDVQGG